MISVEIQTPQSLIPFSQASKTKDYEQWVHFYEKDEVILRVWNQPRKYLSMLKKFHGVISPDFSVQRNMPFTLQAMSITMGRALGNFWQQNLIEVIPNVRFNGEKTYDISFDGLDEHANLAIGTLGCLRNKEERKIFEAGLEEMMNRLHPKNLIVYGDMPPNIFDRYKDETNLINFPSRISVVHGRKK